MKKLFRNCLISDKLTDLLINGEYIESISPNLTDNADIVQDMNGMIIIPGMIDLHTHIRDMVLSYKEDWATASSAAFAGGVTTIFDMPNTLPPTDCIEHLKMKREAARKSVVNYGIYAGATSQNLPELQEMLERYNIAGIKIFLAASSSNDIISDELYLRKIFELSKKFDKPILTHSELQNCIETYALRYSLPEYDNAIFHNLIRDRKCAFKATQLVLKIASDVGNALHILHVSTREEISLIQEYKVQGNFPLSCEVTPHHLFIDESILQNVGNIGKVNPPLRTKEDREALMQALLDGYIDTIGSDHAPHSFEEKQKNYFKAPSGFPGLETSLPLLINEHLKNAALTLELIIKLTSENPSKIMKVKNRGVLAPGNFADFVIIDPKQNWKINPSVFKTKAKYSPYSGMELRGKIIKTFINGEELYPHGHEVSYG